MTTIRGTALQLLMRDPRVHETTIDVQVEDRWLTLKGEVRHQHESDAIRGADRIQRGQSLERTGMAICTVSQPKDRCLRQEVREALGRPYEWGCE